MDDKQRHEVFAGLYDRYGAELFAHARNRVGDKHAADDVVQEALTKVFCTLHSVREQDRFRAWMYAILNNEISDFFRKSRRPLTYLDPRDLPEVAREQDLTAKVRDDARMGILEVATYCGGAHGELLRTLLVSECDRRAAANKLRPRSRRYADTGIQHIRDKDIRAARIAAYRELRQNKIFQYVKLDLTTGKSSSRTLAYGDPDYPIQPPFALYARDYLTAYELYMEHWRRHGNSGQTDPIFSIDPDRYNLPRTEEEVDEWEPEQAVMNVDTGVMTRERRKGWRLPNGSYMPNRYGWISPPSPPDGAEENSVKPDVVVEPTGADVLPGDGHEVLRTADRERFSFDPKPQTGQC